MNSDPINTSPINLGLLEQEFSSLDALPDALYDLVITHTHGPLLTRARGILQWRERLLAGQLPEMDELCWPEESLRRTLLMRIETLELAAFCEGQETLTDSVLKDICDGISSAEDYLAKTGDKFRDKLAQRQNIKEKDSSFRDEEGLADHVQSQTAGAVANSKSGPETKSNPKSKLQINKTQGNTHSSNKQGTPPSEDQQHRSDTDANNTSSHGANPTPQAGQQANATQSDTPNDNTPTQQNPDPALTEQINAGQQVVDRLQQGWREMAENWQQLSDADRQIEQALCAFGQDARSANKSLPGRGWDLSTGLLTSEAWRDIVRYRQRIKDHPELIRFIVAIGRDKKRIGDDRTATIRKGSEPTSPPAEKGKVSNVNSLPRKILEMDGIERGDDINRILPAELALLCHPLLKTLWHARRAERLLLLYQHQGKRGPGKKTRGREKNKAQPAEQGKKGQSSLGRGPIIVCLDTSGSMHGEPEHIAKAVVLEALKIAHKEQRPCHLYAFSGPQQASSHQLDLRRGGLIALLKFLQFSFHGGTDLSHALQLALHKQAEENWQKADILLVSDGRFPVDRDILATINNYKRNCNLRLFGILTGSWQHHGIESWCDDVLRIRV